MSHRQQGIRSLRGADDDDDNRPVAADRAEVLVLLKTGTLGTGATASRLRAWARVRLACSATRKIARTPLYWVLVLHSVATVTVGYFFIACVGSLFEYVGASKHKQDFARNATVLGIGASGALSLVVGGFLRWMGAARGSTCAAAGIAAVAVAYTACFATAIAASPRVDGRPSVNSDDSFMSLASRELLLFGGYGAVLFARILSYALLNLAIPVLFDRFAMGIGLALGFAFTVGGGVSALAGRALTSAVHHDPDTYMLGLVVSLGAATFAVDAALVVALRLRCCGGGDLAAAAVRSSPPAATAQVDRRLQLP